MADPLHGRCPDFELAEPEAFDPKILVPVEGEPQLTRQTKELVLLLGLAFNDLKLLSWTQQQLEKGRPDDAEFSPYAGQWRGMTESLNRWAAGAMWEVGKLLVRYQDIIAAPIVKAALNRARRMNREAKVAWRSTVAFANAHRQHKDARQYYAEVRNELAYHYEWGGDTILEGYRSHFTERSAEPAGARAYASMGNKMETTRFFFSDAAAQGATTAKRQRLRLPGGTMLGYAKLMNVALRFVVEGLLLELKEIAASDTVGD